MFRILIKLMTFFFFFLFKKFELFFQKKLKISIFLLLFEVFQKNKFLEIF